MKYKNCLFAIDHLNWINKFCIIFGLNIILCYRKNCFAYKKKDNI